MNAEQFELVTAYVDGEATADERAAVEADAELLAEVERQRSLRESLRHVPPPSDQGREAAVAAALAVFDEQRLSSTPASEPSPQAEVTAPANVVSLERRRRVRLMQGVGAAAAAAVVVVAGAVVITRGGDDDGTKADREQPAATSTEREAADDIASATTAIVTTTVGPEIMAVVPDTDLFAADQVPDATDSSGAAESDEATEAATGSVPDEGALAESPSPAAPAAAAPTTTPALVVIVTSDELADLADSIKEAIPGLGDATEACADELLKADATFEAGDGAQLPIVVVELDDGTIGAMSLASCDIVLEAER